MYYIYYSSTSKIISFLIMIMNLVNFVILTFNEVNDHHL